jgi:hypothetical protein
MVCYARRKQRDLGLVAFPGLKIQTWGTHHRTNFRFATTSPQAVAQPKLFDVAIGHAGYVIGDGAR